MNKLDCKVDQIKEEIIISKSFAKAAGIINSAEYEMLKMVRRDNPNFKVVLREIKKKEGKQTYRNLSYENMKMFITTLLGEDSPKLKEFEEVKKLSCIQNGPYAYVKEWFLKNFKDEYYQGNNDEVPNLKVV